MRKTFYALLVVLILMSMGIMACGAKATPKTITKIVTQEVTREVSKTMPTVAVTVQVPVTFAEAGDTLKTVQARGKVLCGNRLAVRGFGIKDEATQEPVGFDIDICRAVAAAIFDDPKAIEIVVPAGGNDRWVLLQNGSIDLLAASATWTFTRDSTLGIDFTPIMFYDGQGIMVGKASGITDLNGLNGGKICALEASTSETNIVTAVATNNIDVELIKYPEIDLMAAGYGEGKCDAITIDKSILIDIRLGLADPAAHTILDITLSKEPLAPAVRHGDNSWEDLVTWVSYCTLQAEELGVTSKNVDEMVASSTDPSIKALLGVEGELGKGLGLSNDFCAKVIRGVGNYAEIYDRNLGPTTPIDLSRGLNKLWTNGGLLYSPPFR